jgi:hypothetical protein
MGKDGKNNPRMWMTTGGISSSLVDRKLMLARHMETNCLFFA